MMVKLNLKRIGELEEQNQGNQIYLNTLQQMIDIVMTPVDPLGLANESNVVIAANTLRELGVLDDPKTETKEPEHLNS